MLLAVKEVGTKALVKDGSGREDKVVSAVNPGNTLLLGIKRPVYQMTSDGEILSLTHRGHVFVASKDAKKYLPEGYLMQRDVFLVKVIEGTDEEKIVLVPGTDAYGLVRDEKRIRGIEAKFGDKIKFEGKMYAEKGKRTLFYIREVALTRGELEENLELLLQTGFSYRPILICAKDSLRVMAMAKLGRGIETCETFLGTTKLDSLAALIMK